MAKAVAGTGWSYVSVEAGARLAVMAGKPAGRVPLGGMDALSMGSPGIMHVVDFTTEVLKK